MLDCAAHDATNTIGIQYPQSVFGVSGGRRSAAVSLHHLLPLQVTAESLINTPSQGESPITPSLSLSLVSHLISIPLPHVSDQYAVTLVCTFHSSITFSLQMNRHSGKIKRCTDIRVPNRQSVRFRQAAAELKVTHLRGMPCSLKAYTYLQCLSCDFKVAQCAAPVIMKLRADLCCQGRS